MTRDPLTQEERDALSEAVLIEYDLRHLKRAPSEEAIARRMVRGRVRHERRVRKQDKAG